MIRQAILTKFIGPAAVKGARVKATTGNGRIALTLPWDHAVGVDANHARAAVALANKLHWTGTMIQGGMDNGSAFVFIDWGEGQTVATVQESR